MGSSAFDGARVLVTGGAGFIGSTLAIRLVELGARVTLVDAMLPGYGGNLFNIEPIKDRIWLNISDIRDVGGMNYLVRGQDYVFHLAAQVSHVQSLTDPFPDIDINIKGTAVLLEACKAHNRHAVVVRAGTRGQYGPATRLPVSEDAPMNPKGLYEISQLAAEKTLQVYHDQFGIPCVNLRLTNIYGPRAQMRSPHFGVANWFVRVALDDDTIKVFGDGSIKRDFLYVDDCVEAMIRCAADAAAHGGVFNVGAGSHTTFKAFAEDLIRIAGTGRWEFAPFTPERAAQEPGDFYSDITAIRTAVGWEPRTALADGIRRTVDYYRRHRAHYW
jgi:UDP-glucose 4-epimerase